MTTQHNVFEERAKERSRERKGKDVNRRREGKGQKERKLMFEFHVCMLEAVLVTIWMWRTALAKPSGWWTLSDWGKFKIYCNFLVYWWSWCVSIMSVFSMLKEKELETDQILTEVLLPFKSNIDLTKVSNRQFSLCYFQPIRKGGNANT